MKFKKCEIIATKCNDLNSLLYFSDLPDPPVRTVTETVLPWKRDDDSSASDPAKPQEEFPTWVNNRDYYPGYLSPSPTFLERISDKPFLYNVQTIHESIGEEEEPPFDNVNIQKSSTEPAAEFRRRSWSQSREKKLYSSSADDFSLSSSDSPRENSAETISIECPDVAVDIEMDEADTNL